MPYNLPGLNLHLLGASVSTKKSDSIGYLANFFVGILASAPLLSKYLVAMSHQSDVGTDLSIPPKASYSNHVLHHSRTFHSSSLQVSDHPAWCKEFHNEFGHTSRFALSTLSGIRKVRVLAQGRLHR